MIAGHEETAAQHRQSHLEGHPDGAAVAGQGGELDALEVEVLAQGEAADIESDTQAADHLEDRGLDVRLVAAVVELGVGGLGRRVEAADEDPGVGIDLRIEEGAVDRLGQQTAHGRGRVDRGCDGGVHGQQRGAGRGDAGVREDRVESIEPEDPLHMLGEVEHARGAGSDRSSEDGVVCGAG
ncbi:hypothetical protein ACSRUE_21355 [Sorangium sp. KYC3313]|uniref:hypothetical protein n=1 Tax=Sorangium sp. KYC3313 TaxID=3449740 RepID=UPI003F88E009